MRREIMRVTGDVRLNVPLEEAFRILTDPEALSGCTPGLETMEIITPGRRFRGSGAVAVGTARIHYSTDIEWMDLHPPRGARMRMLCRAHRRTLEIGSEFALSDGRDGFTDMRWTADIRVHGALAGLLLPLIKPGAVRIAREFLECIRRKIEAGASASLA